MITVDTQFKELNERKNLKPVLPYLIWNGEGKLQPEKAIKDVQLENPTWAAKDMVYGLNRLNEIADTGITYVYNVYPKDKLVESPAMEHVKLIHFPAKNSTKFVILAAGGGYGAVCSLAEAFPVAAKLNELGIAAFCLNYRVGPPELMPKPMDDLAAACNYIQNNAKSFGVNPTHYAVGGFSAGGHLAASWGTERLGFRNYGLPAPELLILNYPLLAMWRTLSSLPVELSEMMLDSYFGEHYSKETCRPYDIDENIDSGYPPIYLIHSKDDDTVPIWNSTAMVKALVKQKVAYRFETPGTGGHGYGLGNECSAAGWVERAIAYWKELNYSRN